MSKLYNLTNCGKVNGLFLKYKRATSNFQFVGQI